MNNVNLLFYSENNLLGYFVLFYCIPVFLFFPNILFKTLVSRKQKYYFIN